MTKAERGPIADLRSAFALAVVGCAALVVTLATNGLAGQRLPAEWRWLADACVPSLAAALGLYVLALPKRPFAWAMPGTPWRRLRRLAVVWLAAWLLGSALSAAVIGYWPAHVQGSARLLCFALLGPLAEELLFRGAIYELAERSFVRWAAAPVVVSTVLFSAYHLQLHHFHVTPFVVMQLAFTLPMGWVFARMRALSGSIWPSFALHVLTNLPHCFGVVRGSVV